MRVLAGKYKSKLIQTIDDPLTRPMMSKVRESVFNSLQFNIENKNILDLYAGSGSLGIESLSRGANFVTFVENSNNCINILKQNLSHFEINYKITKSNVDKFLDTSLNKYDIVFYDPPFKIETEIVKNEIIKIYNLLNKEGFVVVHRHTASKEFETLKNYKIHKEKNFGQSNILILSKL
tara:strand:- start:1806 stop:2342 length:537 start_codon:yes stop_codon:yes gene_type:complete